MNARIKTLSAPYSVRGVLGAPVAMPLTWKKLQKAQPFDYTMANVPQLLERNGDIWSDILSSSQDIERILTAAS